MFPSQNLRPVLLTNMMLAVGIMLFLYATPAWPDSNLDSWRKEVIAARMLAENDIPAALRQAQRLNETLPRNATPADQVRVLNALARAEVYYGQIDQAAQHAEQAFQLALKHEDKAGQAEADLNLAICMVNQGKIEAMNAAIVHSMTTLQGVDRPDLLAEAMLRTSMMYRRIDQLNDSVSVAVQLMSIARHSNNPLVRTYANQAMASANDLGGRPSEAVKYYSQMREEAQRANSTILEAEAIIGMAGALNKIGDVVRAEQLAREAIEMHRKIGANISANRGEMQLAGYLHSRKRTAEAIKILDEVISAYEAFSTPIGLWWGLDTRSQYYLALGDLHKARADAERAYSVAQGIGFPLYLNESASHLAAIAAAAGDFKRAYQMSAEAADVKAKAAMEKAGERMAQLTSRFEQESHLKELDELTRRNERQTAELAQRELHQRWLWTLLGASLLLLAGAAFFMVRLRRSHHRLAAANAKLRISQEEIRGLNLGLEQRVHASTAELRQQTRYLQTLIDMLPMLAWFKDTESRFLAVNQGVAEISGHDAATLIGKTDWDIWPAGLAQAYRRDDTEVMRSRKSKTVQEPILEGGERKWIETYKAAVLDEDGTLLGTVGIARDISQQKASEAAREDALDEAKRLAQMRSQFLAQMSHELRTPLNGILGYAQIMKRGRNLDENQREGLNVIQESGEHLLTLINDILEFAKIDAGKMELNPSAMELERFLRTIISIISIKADQKQLKFITDISPDLPPWIHADERRLRQVLLNLLANAVKFTDQGYIRLNVKMNASDKLCFEVADSGVGIHPEHRERIFHPFEQVGDVRYRVKGTGLGLPITKELLRLMGSDIHVESEPDKGSIFRFELPVELADPSYASTDTEGLITGYQGPRRTILVVDDVKINRAVLIDMLEPLGFELIEASHGQAAVEMMHKHHPDLILMDIAMPEMNGIEATRQIRQLPGGEEVPIIAISASASGQDEAASLAAGMDAFLSKPVEFEPLLKSIAQMLKIKWIQEQKQITLQEEELIVPPPEPELTTLHHLALQGSMRDIVQMAERLMDMDLAYKPFALMLIKLAKGFQSKAILAFVESHLHRETKA